MNMKTIKILYWVLLVIFCLFHVADGFGGIMKTQAGIDAMNKLGMPAYLMPFLGTLKILGVIALVQNKFKTIKEWAFAGFAFTLMGAAVANACAANSQTVFVIMPIGLLAVLLLIYYCWRKLELNTAKK